MESSPVYRMRLDLNVLNHLGLNLYSNVAAVLSEAVANAWDADSTTVTIRIDAKAGVIEIIDEGCGMTIGDANGRFLNVGYNKRHAEGTHSQSGRALMGRKGIGKLSLFSIAKTVVVASIKDAQLHGFSMSVPAIESAIAKGADYHPEPLSTDSLPAMSKGTRIRMEDLRRRSTTLTVAALRKRIARRFSVFGENFKVFVNDEQVTVTDRDDLSKAQFLWEFSGSPKPAMADVPQVVRRIDLASKISVEGRDYNVRGWIGSARKPRDLETDEAGNLNSVVVLARGRLIQENVLDRINIGGLFTKYLTGQIEADFLDLDDEDDIATSDRQRVIEDDPRYQALLHFVRESLNRIETKWTEWRAELGTSEAVQKYPRIQAWIESLPPGSRANAKRVIGSIQGLSIDDEDKRKELLRHGLMAFERVRLTESTDRLASAVETSADELLPIILEQDQLEASLYLDIVRGRLTVISRFSNLVDENAKERVLQSYNRIWWMS